VDAWLDEVMGPDWKTTYRGDSTSSGDENDTVEVGDYIGVMCQANDAWYLEIAQVEGIWLKPSHGKRARQTEELTSTETLPSIPSGSKPTRRAAMNNERALFRVGYLQRAAQARDNIWQSVPKPLQVKFKGNNRGQLLRYIGRRLTTVDVFSAKYILCKLKVEPATLGTRQERVPYYYVAHAQDLQTAEDLAAKWKHEAGKGDDGRVRNAGAKTIQKEANVQKKRSAGSSLQPQSQLTQLKKPRK
jgi:hypothetical protein